MYKSVSMATAVLLGSAQAWAQDAARSAPVSSGASFNPQMSVILDGVYYRDGADGEGHARIGELAGAFSATGHGHEHSHDHGGLVEGFNLRETELIFSATVDPYFDASVFLTVSDSGDIELEEAWFQTRNLPAGLTLRGGRFLSDFGYLNRQHPHQWEFVDANLPYRAFFGEHGLADTGLQLSWLPDWPVYTRFGLEAFQGGHEQFGTLLEVEELGDELEDEGEITDGHAFADAFRARKPGPRLYTAFVELAPDLGYDHALQVGLSAAYARQHQAVIETDGVQALDGDFWLLGTDWVYKYDAGKAYGLGNWTLQAEYLLARADLEVVYDEDEPGRVGSTRKSRQDGFYLQGVYGFAPRWTAGLRYDAVGWTNRLRGGGPTHHWDTSDRWSAAVTFNPTEFSRLRLQWSRADLALEEGDGRFDQVWLQYQLSLGAHGAHAF